MQYGEKWKNYSASAVNAIHNRRRKSNFGMETNHKYDNSNLKVFGLLERVRQRPWFFLHMRSLTSLRDFLAGYETALEDSNNQEPVLGGLRDFGHFVLNHYGGLGKAKGWTVIRDHTKSDEEALDTFFKLLDEYNKQGRPRYDWA
jgi:hypothetical protein